MRFRFSLAERCLSVSLSLILAVTCAVPVRAQSALGLPLPGAMVQSSAAFAPALMVGLTIHPDDPLQMDFFIAPGTDQREGEEFASEGEKLIRYFLAALTVPEDQLWVNLSPYEAHRIIPDELGKTELGRDMLAQDYLLKQLTASLLHPQSPTGTVFWQKLSEKNQEKFGTTEISAQSFHKVWIVPQEAGVRVNGTRVLVTESRLKVMLEEDYLALEHHDKGLDEHPGAGVLLEETKLFFRDIILPEIEREVNEGRHFAALRQIYHAMILAAWYKKTLKESFLGKSYADRNKVSGLESDDPQITQTIYQQYLAAFAAGVGEVITEEYNPGTQEVIGRQYCSGGIEGFKQYQLRAILSSEGFVSLSVDRDAAQLGEVKGQLVKLAARFGLVKSPSGSGAPSANAEDKVTMITVDHQKGQKILNRLRNKEQGAFQAAIEEFLVNPWEPLATGIARVIEFDDNNLEIHIKFVEEHLEAIVRMAMPGGDYSRESLGILEAAARSGSFDVISALARDYIQQGDSDYISDAVSSEDHEVLFALARYENEFIAAINGDDLSAKERALRVLPALVKRDYAIEVLKEAFLVSDDIRIQSALERLILLKDPRVERIYIDKKEQILQVAKSSRGRQRMVALIHQGIRAWDTNAMKMAIEMQDSGLNELIADQVVRHKLTYDWVSDNDISVLGNVVQESKNPSLVISAQRLLAALLESGNLRVWDYTREQIKDAQKGRHFIGVLNFLAYQNPLHFEQSIELLEEIMNSDQIAFENNQTDLESHGLRFSESFYVLGQFFNRGFLRSLDLMKRYVPVVEDLLETNQLTDISIAKIFFGLGRVVTEIPEAGHLIDKHYMQRDVKRVLPPTRNGLTKVATVVIDLFIEGQETHGTIVERALREAIGVSEQIPSYRINFLTEAWTYKSAEDIQDELDVLFGKNMDTVFVVNLSSANVHLPDKVSGNLNFESVASWGREGRAVFTVAAGNEAGANYDTYPDLDNVIVVGSVTRDAKGNQHVADYSNRGPDVSVMMTGGVDAHEGTSFSAPRFNGLLAKALRDNPELSVIDAIRQLLAQAEPIDDPLYQMRYAGAGYLDVGKILARRDEGILDSLPSDVRISASLEDTPTGGIDFDLRNIHLREEGIRTTKFEWSGKDLALDYDGLRIERVTIETVAGSAF